SLRPIQRIIQSANAIRGGELSARIPAAPAKDELGELTDTLNSMLESVETTLNREKRFTSDASHELRTPVAVMRAYTESMLADDGVTDEQRASLATLLNECQRMQKIIGQLLTITRGQEGRYPVCMEQVSLRQLCDGVAETLADRLEEKHVTLRADVPDELTLCADQSLMTELLLNLCENALKYGKPHGRIDVHGEQNDEKLLLTVADDGIGIPPEALPHIFERFYRVDAARDRSGTGLGLSICDWIARVHGGAIRARSRLGEGSVFTVELPAARRQD
ncbi:MAG: HAMP domain-containing sensor histidine kinase, partial [Eubacteriales bacterium]|nr:HAMP domain-containing sensor histidine kinase [Eubacteriales bacterium]